MGRITLRSIWSVLTLITIFIKGPALAASQSDTEDLVTFERDQHTQWVLDSLGLSAESGDRFHIKLELNRKDQTRLQSYGLRVLKTEPVPPRPRLKTKNSPGYNTPESVVESLEAVANTYPDIARTITLGYSVEGRPIVGLVLSDNVYNRESDEPAMRVLGAHHGDEWSSMEVALAVGQRLAEDYAAREDVQALLNEYEIWVVPVVNPDGTAAYSRRNANSVDLNRNYGLTWTPGLGKGNYPFSEPETQAMRMMAFQRSFHHSMSMHSGATNLGWVWNHTRDRTPDEAFLEDVSSRYQDINSTRDFWITNGADWYVVTGDTNDWSYGARGGQDYTLELTSRKAPAANSIAGYVEEHLEAMVQFLATDGKRGRKGRVLNSNGDAVEASLTLVNDEGEPLTGFTLSSATTGAFQRLGFDDTYNLLVEATGYQPQTVEIELSPELQSDPVSIVLESAEPFTAEATVPLIFGHSELQPCVRFDPSLPDGYTAAIYRLGNEEPIHPLTLSQEEDCTTLSLSYRSIPLWEDQGSWHLLIQDPNGDAVYRFEEAVTLISTSLAVLPRLVELGTADNRLNLTLSHDGLNASEIEVIALGPNLERHLLSYLPAIETFQSETIEEWALGTWQLRLTLHGQTWPLLFEVTSDGIELMEPLTTEGVSTTDPADPSDATDPTDASDGTDPSSGTDATEPESSDTGTSDASDVEPTESGIESTDPTDDSNRTGKSDSGCQGSAGASAWLLFAGLLARRRRH